MIISPIQNSAEFLVIWKQKRPRISQTFGERKNYYAEMGYKDGHAGLDFAVKEGTPIYASHDGKVKLLPKNQGYGIGCYIQGRLETIYCHMSEIKVKNGQEVKMGQIIGRVGNTGNSTGAHLHWGVRLYSKGQRYNEGWFDPSPYTICWKGIITKNTL